MKKTITTFAVFTLLLMAFTSCRKETLVQPENTTTTNNGGVSASDDIVLAIPYKLTKRGNDTIIYDASWRIIKVQNTYQHTIYTYGNNTVGSKTYDNLNRLDEEISYQLDPATGRATESIYKGYTHYSIGDVVTTRRHTYQYDANGRLVKKINKDKPLERYLFTYQSNGRLDGMFAYAADGSFQYRIAPYYEYTAGTAITDKVKINPEKITLDMYLKIFGKFSDALVIRYSTIGSGNVKIFDEGHEYSMNRNGYPTLLTKKNLMQNNYGKVIATLPFSYQLAQ